MDFPPGITREVLEHGWFACVDPALLKPALALFHHSFLVAAARVKIPRALADIPIGERCRRVAEIIGTAAAAHLGGERPVALLVERPQIYTASKSKGDPNDLVPLAWICGGLAQGFGCPVISPTAREWAGATTKNTTGDPWLSSRGHLVKSILDEHEFARCEPTHDAIDAVMMGLVALRRIGRYYPGAS